MSRGTTSFHIVIDNKAFHLLFVRTSQRSLRRSMGVTCDSVAGNCPNKVDNRDSPSRQKLVVTAFRGLL
jgi:hypothetical protein